MSSNLTLVHGAAGHLGNEILKQLLSRGHPASSLVAAARNLKSENVQSLAKLGVQLRAADYTDKAELEKAYSGIDTVVYIPIPASDIERAISAENSVAAAINAGVKRFVLVSVPSRVDSVIGLAPGYVYAESRVRTSRLQSWVIVRMGVWTDNFLAIFKHAAQSGVLTAVAEPTDRIPLISRVDSARGIAAAIGDKSSNGKVIDLENSVAVSLPEIAGYISETAGKKVTFKSSTVAEAGAVISSGLPDAMKAMGPYMAQLFGTFWKAGGLGEFGPNKEFVNLTGSQPESARAFIQRNL